MKVYISGAISGRNIEDSKHQFSIASRYLISEGYDVVNPFNLETALLYSLQMKIDIKALLECDAIYMLGGWQFSKGAKAEHDVAEICGMKIMEGVLS